MNPDRDVNGEMGEVGVVFRTQLPVSDVLMIGVLCVVHPMGASRRARVAIAAAQKPRNGPTAAGSTRAGEKTATRLQQRLALAVQNMLHRSE